uniref:P2X purinoreceptor 7 intracellular domain-containing protein n=1 Tax=Neogobius melanostomus TaxID=47308 RepID=A0A8C6UJH8_9GOBI
MESDHSDASSFATNRSWEVEDFSPPSSPEVERDEGAVEADTGPQPYQFELLAHELAGAPHQPDWCVCSRCREMPTDIEKKCCGQDPRDCISQLPQMELYILDEGGLRLTRRIWNDVLACEDQQEPGEDNRQSRYAAYRQYVVWQFGALGRGNRIVIPSCVVWRIRNKHPDPFNQYVGFIPRRL